MPEIDLDQYEQLDWSQIPVGAQDARGVGWRVMAVMLWPEDEAARNQFLAAIYTGVQALISNGDLPPVHHSADGTAFDPFRSYFERYIKPLGGMATVIRSPSLSEHAASIEAAGPGWIQVGCLLRTVHAMYTHHPNVRRGASLNKAVEIFPQLASGVQIPTNPTDVRAAWSRYKRAAHLCAALLALDANDYLVNGRKRERTPKFPYEVSSFLALAREYQTFGLSFKAHGRTETLLPPDLWSVPVAVRLPSVKLTPEKLSPKLLQTLENYKAPKRV